MNFPESPDNRTLILFRSHGCPPSERWVGRGRLRTTRSPTSTSSEPTGSTESAAEVQRPNQRPKSLGRAERDAIREFVKSRRGVVGELRIRTYLAWVPLAGAHIGAHFLDPGRDPPTKFNDEFPTTAYTRASRTTVAQCLASFWRWRLERVGKEYRSWLRIKLEKWTSTSSASDMLTRKDIASIVEHSQNFGHRAWIWTLFNSGCRPGEIYQLRVGDVVPHEEGYIELRVTRGKGSAPEPRPVSEDDSAAESQEHGFGTFLRCCLTAVPES